MSLIRMDAAQYGKEACRTLEAGKVLFWEGIPYEFPETDLEFLLSQKQTDSKLHKNISYRPGQDILRSAASRDPAEIERLHQIMRDFSRRIIEFTGQVLSPYQSKWQLDYASFRPLQEQGRDLPLHKRNDLLHVDAFPSRPTHGGRILRVFTNIHPQEARIWNVTEPFDAIAPTYAYSAGLKDYAKHCPWQAFKDTVGKLVGARGADRSAYDRFMLHFHDWLKENRSFQEEHPKIRLEFPPRTTWMVYTDGVPHAAMSGQFALEQTFIIPRQALVAPEKSPIGVLEAMTGQQLAAA